MQKYKKLSISVAVTGVALWSLHTTANASPGLKLLNAITPNGEVSVIKDLNYGNEPDQNLDIGGGSKSRLEKKQAEKLIK